ncbi:MAG: efflux transporter periplasmic adaptor subunit, partial [Desulfovibrionales bacterium]|nr:efflux transporter periplasmic adaptor subunit [Desulfovibrionales bacterium]
SISARAVFPNPEGDLRAGMYGKAQVTLEKEVESLFVPQEAIMDTLGRKSVFVVDEKGQVTSRTVELGGRHEHLRAIVDGVSPGEMVAVGNLLKLRPGMQVVPKLKTDNSQ